MKQKKSKNINSSIAYRGKVNIELRKGKKVVSKSSYHNEGTLRLFEFLTHCLRGDYNEVEFIRPKFIKIFTIGKKDDPTPTFDSYNNLVNSSDTELLSLTSPIYSGGINISNDESKPSSSASFKFVIPFSQLSGYKNINMISLYSTKYKNGLNDASMFIIIEDEKKHILKDLLEEMNITTIDNVNEYNLFIEWVTTLKNEGE